MTDDDLVVLHPTIGRISVIVAQRHKTIPEDTLGQRRIVLSNRPFDLGRLVGHRRIESLGVGTSLGASLF